MAGAEDTVQALSAAVLAVTGQREVREVLQMVVRSARALLDAEYAALGVPDEADSFAQFVVDGVTDEQWAAIGPLPRRHGVLAAMLKEATPQRLADIRTDARFKGWPAAHPELAGFLGVPVTSGDDILGALYLANKRDGSGFTAADEQLATVLAGHAALALTNARLNERIRELSVIEERTRIARDLHDAVSQKLFSLRLSTSAAESLLDTDVPKARAALVRVRELAGEAAGELQAAIFQLRPAELSADGLADTLRKHVRVLERAHGVRIGWTECDPPTLPAHTEVEVFRVAQEALHNALRHAGAGTLAVGLCRTDGAGVVLTVTDDGGGFDPVAADRGLGIASMRARAAAIGGRLTVRSSAAGTTVRLAVPR